MVQVFCVGWHLFYPPDIAVEPTRLIEYQVCRKRNNAVRHTMTRRRTLTSKPASLMSNFHETVKTPLDLREEVTHCLKQRIATAHQKQHSGSNFIMCARLLPRSHKAHPTHCLLLMSDERYVILTPVLLLRLAEKLPWLGNFKQQGPHTAFKADRFKGLAIVYRWCVR